MKKKYIILSIIALILMVPGLFIIYINFFIKDITQEELGPFPYPTNISMFEENNFEYNQIIEIGKKTNIKEFLNKKVKPEKEKTSEELAEESINLMRNRRPKKDDDEIIPSKEKYLEFFNQNKECIELAENLDISKIKFPISKIDDHDQNYIIINFINLMHEKANYEVLYGDFESAYSEILKLNKISNILINKMPFAFLSVYPLNIKKNELTLIILLFNKSDTTYSQKLKLIELKHENIDIQTIINFTNIYENYYQFDAPKELDKKSETELIIKIVKFINPSYSAIYLPNKTKLEKRKKLEQIVDLEKKQILENQKGIDTAQRKLNSFKGIDYKSNFVGKIEANMMPIMLFIVLGRKLKINNMIHQLQIAKALIIYKENKGEFPNNLSDLNLDNSILIDNMTGKPFIYAPKYGFLQRMDSDYSDDIIIEPNAEFSQEELQEIRSELKGKLIILN